MPVQRGRKSAAHLSIVALTPGTRPEPPDNLTPAQQELWRNVTATKPTSWFARDTFPLLAAYCRHATTVEKLSQAIDAITDLTDPEQRALHEGFVKLRGQESKSMLSAATAMRLTQHSSVKAETAQNANASGGGEKPWQTQ